MGESAVIRLLGLVLIALTGLGTGVYASLSLRKRVEQLELCSRLIRWMETRIRYAAAPVGELIREAKNEPEFDRLSFVAQTEACLCRGMPPSSAWQKALEEDKSGWLSPQDRELLAGFGAGLGTTDVEGQQQHCRYFAERLEEQLQTARTEAAVKGRLYISLGVMGGAGISLLLI